MSYSKCSHAVCFVKPTVLLYYMYFMFQQFYWLVINQMINEIYIFYSVVNDFDKLYSRKIICQKNVLVEKIFLQI